MLRWLVKFELPSRFCLRAGNLFTVFRSRHRFGCQPVFDWF